MITLVPEGGLCNRMRAIASTWALSRSYSQQLRVWWYRSPDLNASFEDLFDASHAPFLVQSRRWLGGINRARLISSEALRRLIGRQTLHPGAIESGTAEEKQLLEALSGRSAWIRTCSQLTTDADMYRCFVPAQPIRDSVSRLTPRLRESVGVHIRRTDNERSTIESPTEAFVALMARECAARRDTSFFVATDSPDVLDELRREFGSRVWSHEKRAYARSESAAIVDAAIDLYALSGCRKLIGSFWSSFSDTASALRGIPLVVAKKQS